MILCTGDSGSLESTPAMWPPGTEQALRLIQGSTKLNPRTYTNCKSMSGSDNESEADVPPSSTTMSKAISSPSDVETVDSLLPLAIDMINIVIFFPWVKYGY
jgi:hypothetical protein